MTEFVPLKECKNLNDEFSLLLRVKGMTLPKYLKRKYNKWWSCIRIDGIVIANNGDRYINWYVAKWHLHCLIIYFRRLVRYLRIKFKIR